MKKKLLPIITAIILSGSLFVGCNASNTGSPNASTTKTAAAQEIKVDKSDPKNTINAFLKLIYNYDSKTLNDDVFTSQFLSLVDVNAQGDAKKKDIPDLLKSAHKNDLSVKLVKTQITTEDYKEVEVKPTKDNSAVASAKYYVITINTEEKDKSHSTAQKKTYTGTYYLVNDTKGNWNLFWWDTVNK